MPKGIIVFGSSGVGDTTLGKELARRLNYAHIDIDEFSYRWDTEIPYTSMYSREERIEILYNQISKHPYFIMSGMMWSIRKTFEPFFVLAAYITAPIEVRAERIRTRELSRWGNRVLPGGDMYEAKKEFYGDYLAAARKYEQREEWLTELTCPVLYIDGTKSINENAELIYTKHVTMQATE